jgi:CheY-like chemotaxis protein/HPt (histidine-containing phosphotransfer) domain-containing protein
VAQPNIPVVLPIGIPGLDVETALGRMSGKRRLYLAMLDSFVETHATAVDGILVDLRAGNLEEAERRAHKLKGMAGTIGATSLEAAASELETVLRGGGTAGSIESACEAVGRILGPLVAALEAQLSPGSSKEAAATVATVATVAGVPGAGFRVLVVDDMPDTIRLLSASLSDDYSIVPAGDGEEALRIATSASPPDLILLDVSMPGMDGFAVCERLKLDESTRRIPVIFITSADDIGRKTRGFAVGAVDYITKPFELREVQARLRTQVSLAEARKRLESQNEELVAAAELREDVERITRHDLKGPLNAMIALPQMLLAGDGLDSDQRESLGLILESGQKMLRMINLSFDLFKMERHLYVPMTVEVDIVKVMAEVWGEFASVSRAGRIDRVVRVDGLPVRAGLSKMALGEELLCYCLFSNLVKNAIEASPDGASIGIRIDGADPVSVAVTNEGEVPPAIRDRFFEKYVTAGKRDGTGLGTYSSRLIAATLGGTILLDCSTPGSTTVSVTLPGPGK